MFDLFKKKKSSPKAEIEKQSLSEAEKNKLQASIEQLMIQIHELELADEATHPSLAEKYEMLGLLYSELQEEDLAISALEKSLSYKNSIGKGYKKLMHLYNQKRATAAQTGDGEAIELWMSKMDDMRQIAKKVTISGQ